jgi:hypothetical protein
MVIVAAALSSLARKPSLICQPDLINTKEKVAEAFSVSRPGIQNAGAIRITAPLSPPFLLKILKFFEIASLGRRPDPPPAELVPTLPRGPLCRAVSGIVGHCLDTRLARFSRAEHPASSIQYIEERHQT